ncbi:sporulation-specific protein 22 [Stygiomarasmius scandens]|uniref:Protein ZIP4 homolog n=1 Tax=Marasmiellus scandens TaxID=2682957 RepID=A0ABR1JIW0_9AGAR
MSGSARKKKAQQGLQQTFESIKDLLITTKTQLDDTDVTVRPSLIQNLRRVATLAESFTEKRPNLEKDWIQLADTLDQEGVNLWNISGLVRKHPEDDGRSLVGALRLAAFRLVEAGLEAKPGLETLLHILQLASKTGATLSELGNNDAAASVLTSAAKFEEKLRAANDPDGTHRQSKACATIVYLSSRMEAAWREGNCTVAEFMSQKIIADNDQRLALPAHDRLTLAVKFHVIGKSILKNQTEPHRSKPSDSVVWLQKALSIADQLEDSTNGLPELKISILRTLARAYFLSESFDSAEATLEELVPSIDASSDHASSEYQELRWLRLAVLKRRRAANSAVLDAYKSIIDHMELSETNLTDILQDLRTLTGQHVLVTNVNQHLLKRTLECHAANSNYVDRMLLSLIIHCSRDDNHSRAMEVIDAAFTSVCEADIQLQCVPAMACLSLLWQYGDRHYNAKRWSEAADWFVTGSHRLLRDVSPTSSSKCFRKAALCYIEQKQYARASVVIRRCLSNEAATHYITFLTAIHQGLEDEATEAIHSMIEAPDFSRNMLLLATQISHESEMKIVLLKVLEALLKTLKVTNGGETVVEAMTLLRCIIRLALKLLIDPTANKSTLILCVVKHFQTAQVLVNAACEQKAIALIIKDVSWLWRTAYNCAVQGCSDWEGYQEQISALFDLARDLLIAYCESSPVEVDPELYVHLINASFSGVSGRIFTARGLKSSGNVDVEQLREIATEIKTCTKRITQILEKHAIVDNSDCTRIQYFLHTLRVFEAEILVQLKEWDQVLQLVDEIAKSAPLAIGTYEAIADILWTEKDCPINVLYGGLEAILHASLDNNTLSVEKFSRWLRAICTIILARNTPADRVKAIGYVEQAVSVMEQSIESDEAYPVDERFWLLSTSYNTGFECLEASMLDEAKRWFESSTVICRFVPGGAESAKKISETYTQLLARYAPS